MMIKTITFKQQLINLLRTGFLFFITFHTLIAQPLAIKGGRIITISGSVIDKGTILIDGGIIRDVGLDIKIPKDADIIVLDGDPLSIKTWVERVYISGKLVHTKNEMNIYRSSG